jgi:hypothetical protein
VAIKLSYVKFLCTTPSTKIAATEYVIYNYVFSVKGMFGTALQTPP